MLEKRWFILLGILTLVAVGLLSAFVSSPGGVSTVAKVPMTPQMFLELVRRFVRKESMAKLITAQAMLETSRFHSYSWRTRINAFGMGGEGNLQTFDSPEASIVNLLQWLKRHRIGLNISSPDTYSFLLRQAGYYTAPEEDYTLALKLMLKELKEG